MRIALLALLLCLACAPGAFAQASCADDGEVGYVCGVNNPEDLLRVDGTPFVLVGNLGTEDERGGFYSVDARTRKVEVVRPSFSQPASAEYPGCPGPPDAQRFTVHGIDLTTAGSTRTVYAVNHGDRESIEVFRLTASDAGLALTWIGCALTPDAQVANSVAALPGGGFVTTIPVLSQAELPNAGLGRPTGAVLRWTRAAGWERLPEVQLSFPNGILVSPDGSRLYVAGYTEQAVAALSPATGATLAKVEVPYNPDNLRWAPDGQILAAGQRESPAVVQFTCVQSSVETCAVPTGVSRIDPATLRATTIFERPGDEKFGAGTSAIVVGDELWIGSFRAQRLLRVPRRELAAPVAGEPTSGTPTLRLTRRCVGGGRLRVQLTGDVDRVRDVSFKFGKRLIARDRSAPLRRVLSRRALRSTRARRLRAVAYLRDGPPVRVILARSLPRCGA